MCSCKRNTFIVPHTGPLLPSCGQHVKCTTAKSTIIIHFFHFLFCTHLFRHRKICPLHLQLRMNGEAVTITWSWSHWRKCRCGRSIERVVLRTDPWWRRPQRSWTGGKLELRPAAAHPDSLGRKDSAPPGGLLLHNTASPSAGWPPAGTPAGGGGGNIHTPETLEPPLTKHSPALQPGLFHINESTHTRANTHRAVKHLHLQCGRGLSSSSVGGA